MKKQFALGTKIFIILGILIGAYLISYKINSFFGLKTIYGGVVKEPVSEITVFHQGSEIVTGKVYKLFEIAMTKKQSDFWYGKNGNIINNVYYTPCDPSTPVGIPQCGSFDMMQKKSELFDYSKYKQKIGFNLQDIELYNFLQQHSTNLIKSTDVALTNFYGLRSNYRTANYDFIINCNPLTQRPGNTRYRYNTEKREDCIIIRKADDDSNDGSYLKAIVTNYWQPKGFTFLENTLIWAAYNENVNKMEYFLYKIE